MTGLVLQNVLAYSEQIAILIAVAALLSAALKLTAPARLHCFQLVLAGSLVLPFAQPWRVPAVKSAVTATTLVLAEVTPSRITSGPWTPSLAQMIAGILLTGILVRLTLIALGMMRLRRYIENARFVPTAFGVEKERAGAWPDVFISGEIKGPVTFGFTRPAILIPALWAANETIALHELLHVRRRDWAFAVVEEFIRALLWFHPGVWWLIGQIQLAREEVVDRKVVELMQSRERYLDTLLAIAEAKAGLDLAPAPLFLKKRHLRQRVAALLKEVNMSKIRITSSLAGFAAIVGIAGWMAVRSFPLQAAPQSTKDAPGVTVRQEESKLLHRTPVRYPLEAREKGIQGTVIVEVTIDQKGEVSDAQVLSGPQELRKAALESVLQWHYNKEMAAGVKSQVAIDFVLPPASAPAAVKSMPQFPSEGPVITKIDISRVPEPLREQLAGRLPIHLGDRFSPAKSSAMAEALAGIDDHLQVGFTRTPEGTGLVIALGPVAPDQGLTPQRIRVGGNVQAINLINKVMPVYPPLAKQARVQGTVRFTATIAKDGHVLNLELVTGHPLLVAAAQEAVQQWVYKPTLLNGDPVEVVTQIDVNFTLADEPPPPAAAAERPQNDE